MTKQQHLTIIAALFVAFLVSAICFLTATTPQCAAFEAEVGVAEMFATLLYVSIAAATGRI